MSGTLVNLIIQIIAGAIGGNAAGAALKDYSLGTLGNTIAGVVGGGIGGQILQALVPALAQAASTTDWGSIVGQVAGGKAVAGQAARDRQQLRDPGHRAVERRVEHGDVRKIR